jgi:hypothetical protein
VKCGRTGRNPYTAERSIPGAWGVAEPRLDGLKALFDLPGGMTTSCLGAIDRLAGRATDGAGSCALQCVRKFCQAISGL